MSAAFIDKTSFGSGSLRVAIKDIIDVEGTITTAACRAVEKIAKPAISDAVCIRTIRSEAQAGHVRVVGKTNLHELAFGATGINPVYGTPENPLDATRMPGGSSSGSAVAVATNEADIALGSDTGGSIRIPASCCGVVGLKTTWGRISTAGVWGLSPFLDTIGPMARTVTDAITGMELLEPGFMRRVPSLSADSIRVARARPEAAVTDPTVDAAVDHALRTSQVNIGEVEIALWDEIQRSCLTVLLGEAWREDKHLLKIADGVSEPTAQRLALGASISDDELTMARAVRAAGLRSLDSIFANADVIVMPSTPTRAPLLNDASTPITAFTRFANLLGLPALSIPVPVPASFRSGTDAHLPASLQIIGRPNADEMVCGVGLVLATAAF
jgi:amidase